MSIGNYWCIVTYLPVPGSEERERNYYCRTLRHQTGVVVNEWDTDSRYSMRFKNSTAAENFKNLVLKELDGLEVIEHPGNINLQPSKKVNYGN